MPIFHVDVLTGDRLPRVAPDLANDLGALMRAEPGHVWVRLSACHPEDYGENAVAASDVPRWVHVRVILRAVPPEPELAELASQITRIVAQRLEREPDNVHVLFEPPAAGRIAFSGELVRSSC